MELLAASEQIYSSIVQNKSKLNGVYAVRSDRWEAPHQRQISYLKRSQRRLKATVHHIQERLNTVEKQLAALAAVPSLTPSPPSAEHIHKHAIRVLYSLHAAHSVKQQQKNKPSRLHYSGLAVYVAACTECHRRACLRMRVCILYICVCSYVEMCSFFFVVV